MCEMEAGESWTQWTIRVAFILYCFALVYKLRKRDQITARTAWTFACLALGAHLFCAFHFYHRWSHDIAYEATARQTAETIGLNWGGGIYANYAVAVLWTIDVLWWWLSPANYLTRPRILEWVVQGFLAFMFFNATVVFGAGIIRVVGLAAFLILALVLLHRRRISS
jgi:hypothetical protein